MNQILLRPTDVLFFRDGRPMGGASTGHGAAWPLPTVINAALHAALWRSGLATTAHTHVRKFGRERTSSPERFGSLTTAGPFPVCTHRQVATWFFPRPLDADFDPTENTPVLLATPAIPLPGSQSSLRLPLPATRLTPPSKDAPGSWWSEGAWNTYLGTAPRDDLAAQAFIKTDGDFSDREATIGIAIDPATGTTGQGDAEGKIYSAHYLRLREGWRLGLFAETAEKSDDPSKHGKRDDLVATLLAAPEHLLVGGQQRLCTAKRISIGDSRLPLPLGRNSDFATAALPGLGDQQPKHLVKWVLLSPAIFPAIENNEGHSTTKGEPILPHTGGWLPTWVKDDDSRQVLLRAPLPPREVAHESREAYRDRVRNSPPISARLVAALVGKPIPVTGWSLGTPDLSANDEPSSAIRAAGAKPTHLAVPAGSVYYFACASETDARNLANALNWHGDTPGTHIRNRRSTLLGEKGFGLGVCSAWRPLDRSPAS